MEMHPDGYAFLRVNGLLSSPNDIYVSPAQIRRFGLRAGDKVSGKVRPLREGDKYAALLTVVSVNDGDPEASPSRPAFDSLTAVYPTRRIHLELEDPKRRATRFVDAIAPLGFGQRALLLC
jgi:transcription termination factor Rho